MDMLRMALLLLTARLLTGCQAPTAPAPDPAPPDPPNDQPCGPRGHLEVFSDGVTRCAYDDPRPPGAPQ